MIIIRGPKVVLLIYLLPCDDESTRRWVQGLFTWDVGIDQKLYKNQNNIAIIFLLSLALSCYENLSGQVGRPSLICMSTSRSRNGQQQGA
uniref:Uncharacterized protein n=1 Tax=Romanomermis culicivorax TaxID=13658 RepID=A0A915LBH3_ROMCU